MSAKNSFDNNYKPKKILTSKTLNEIGAEVESAEYVEAYIKDRDKFIPAIDFTTASNFAKYGSAEQYYEDAATRIYRTYPYDGSSMERLRWHNSSSYLDES